MYALCVVDVCRHAAVQQLESVGRGLNGKERLVLVEDNCNVPYGMVYVQKEA